MNYMNVYHSMRTTPWLINQAVEFLQDFLNSRPNAHVLEFGAGGSTIWFSKITPNVITVEHDSFWSSQVKECCDTQIIVRPRPYDDVCENFDDNYFDLVLIDGRDRVKCAMSAMSKVKVGGVLMLDNAERERYQPIVDALESWPHRFETGTEPFSKGYSWSTYWWVKPALSLSHR